MRLTVVAESPKALLRLADKLFPGADDRAAFLEALTHPPTFAPTVLWTRSRAPENDWQVLPPLPWQPDFVDRLVTPTRPGSHPLHDQGAFYCLDFSSVFAVSAVQAIAAPVTTAIDLCAAPGGKSLYLWRSLQPQTLVCNEVIRKRVKILIANLKRCGAMDAIVLNQDPAVLAAHLPHSAQLVLVDAPCSGQSLLAKGEAVPGCFHRVTLNRNANRQKRILAHAATLVQSEGHLLYTTCTYSPEENEQIGTWFLKKFPDFTPVKVAALHAYQSPLTEIPCYRLFPQTGLGAGAFALLLQRAPGEAKLPLNLAFLEQHQFKLWQEPLSSP